jgi:hypothetical protein
MLPSGYLEMSRAEYASLDVSTAREVFKACREVLYYFMTREEVATSMALRAPVTPVDWIMAVVSTKCKCERCSGTGTYCWGGTVNGVPVHSADCARCAGKGVLTFDDMRRGRAYDNYAISRAFNG